MIDTAIWPVELEIRQRRGERLLSGLFNYGSLATIRDRGRVRKERFGPNAFGWQLREFAKLQEELAAIIGGAIDEAIENVAAATRSDPDGDIELRQRDLMPTAAQAKQAELAARNIDLLFGHNFSQPLASMLAGTLKVRSDNRALRFEATLPPDSRQPSWMRDAVQAVEAGLVRGLSPGFRVPPRSVVPDAETTIPEPGTGVFIRQVNQALIPEMSLVTRPAYTGHRDLNSGRCGAL